MEVEKQEKVVTLVELRLNRSIHVIGPRRGIEVVRDGNGRGQERVRNRYRFGVVVRRLIFGPCG